MGNFCFGILRGILTGDFPGTLRHLLGAYAPGLSAATISRFKQNWEQDYRDWNQRDLSKKRYVYIWVDWVCSNVRLDDRLCLLVIIGSDETGRKELLESSDGYRELAASWEEVLTDLQHRGLKIAPKLAIGDGALGFWKVVTKLWPETRGQTYEAFDPCIDLFIPKYPKAMECFAKDKASMLFFYDDLAENWQHIRTTNPVESVFSTVRLRQPKPRIVEAWQRRWLWRLSKWKQHGKIVSAKGQQVINGCHQWH